MGVGNASATATQAMLLTVLQDVFSRLTTICGAYYLGSSLYPEAKLYRFLADVLNDLAIILDTLSPLLMAGPIPGLRVAALCLSSSFRALCGLAAGGSKAAITLHFASPVGAKGDVGDLNAKDASKETVLALTGMLLGTLIVPYLTTAPSIYSVLFILVASHLGINYLGVRGLTLRTLNRQRAALAWLCYRQTRKALSPTQLAQQEHLLDNPTLLRDPETHRVLGKCILGSSASSFLRKAPKVEDLDLQAGEKYFLWYNAKALEHSDARLELHICLKEGHNPQAHLKAWAHAATVASLWSRRADRMSKHNLEEELAATIRTAYESVHSASFTHFLGDMEALGWDIKESVLMAGTPRSLLKEITRGSKGQQRKVY
ncbi:hypothetical protein HGRIS_000156 [Hohenbuehelia grisea]|uniref:DUF647-domain-containing protein n=1 Tax=Hohenbuehelia grisea TaxID=104357 RepID=A0ABR3JQ83_9AGAR